MLQCACRCRRPRRPRRVHALVRLDRHDVAEASALDEGAHLVDHGIEQTGCGRRQMRRPFSRATAIMRSQSATRIAIGFSTSTLAPPPRIAAIASFACVAGGVTTCTTLGSTARIISFTSVKAGFARRRTALGACRVRVADADDGRVLHAAGESGWTAVIRPAPIRATRCCFLNVLMCVGCGSSADGGKVLPELVVERAALGALREQAALLQRARRKVWWASLFQMSITLWSRTLPNATSIEHSE